MLKCIINSFILLLLSNISETIQKTVSSAEDLNPNIYEESLYKIDLSKDSILNAIFHEIVSEDVEHTELYEVTMNDYYEGTIIQVTKCGDEILDGSLLWDGYSILDNRKFVIDKIYSNYELYYSCPRQHELFRMIRYNKISSRKPVSIWFYYILGDIYARFSPEAGWIWSDGKPDE